MLFFNLISQHMSDTVLRYRLYIHSQFSSRNNMYKRSELITYLMNVITNMYRHVFTKALHSLTFTMVQNEKYIVN